MTTRPYQMCTRCVMDTSASDISFNQQGICNYCTDFLLRSDCILHENPVAKQTRLEAFVAKVKERGRGKPYDCVVGVSGGVDSSWVLVKAVEMGLRPLAVHMDNGWNSELSQNNIANLVHGLDVDLYTHVIDWEEYRGLMQAFFDADVIDIEILYDNAMLGVNYNTAAAHNIHYILFGSNIATEGITLPKNWIWLKNDARNIRAIGKRNGTKLKTFPAFSTFNLVWRKIVNGINAVSILDMLEYNKEAALLTLESEYGYKRYPYKHYESIFTRFYQGYILPEKFNVDKRRIHLSTLILTRQLPRDEALKHFESIPYPSEQALKEDKDYFLKKMGWSLSTLETYLARPEIPHSQYSSEKVFFDMAFALKPYIKNGLYR
jgi:N-acetyl sugar amidotransferase